MENNRQQTSSSSRTTNTISNNNNIVLKISTKSKRLPKKSKTNTKYRSKSAPTLRSTSTSKMATKTKTANNMANNMPREKKDEYRYISKNSILKDIKNTAIISFNQIRNTIGTILKLDNNKINNDENGNYYNINDQPPTPIKIYSPFTIETPTANRLTAEKILEERNRIRQQLFTTTSPTGKFHEDIQYLDNGMKTLNLIQTKIIPDKYQKSIKQQQSEPEQENDDLIINKTSNNTISMKPLIEFPSEECLF